MDLAAKHGGAIQDPKSDSPAKSSPLEGLEDPTWLGTTPNEYAAPLLPAELQTSHPCAAWRAHLRSSPEPPPLCTLWDVGQLGVHPSSPPISSPAAPLNFHFAARVFVVLWGFQIVRLCSKHSTHLAFFPLSQVLSASRAFHALLTPISKFTLFLISHLFETALSYLCLTIGFCSALSKCNLIFFMPQCKQNKTVL